MDYDLKVVQAGRDLGGCSAKKLERHENALKQIVARLQLIIDASQLPDEEDESKDASQGAETAIIPTKPSCGHDCYLRRDMPDTSCWSCRHCPIEYK